jgi:hypothetical protein
MLKNEFSFCIRQKRKKTVKQDLNLITYLHNKTNKMKNYKIFNIFFIAILVLTTFSCGKKGCTDIDASNYDSKAKKK